MAEQHENTMVPSYIRESKEWKNINNADMELQVMAKTQTKFDEFLNKMKQITSRTEQMIEQELEETMSVKRSEARFDSRNMSMNATSTLLPDRGELR